MHTSLLVETKTRKMLCVFISDENIFSSSVHKNLQPCIRIRRQNLEGFMEGFNSLHNRFLKKSWLLQRWHAVGLQSNFWHVLLSSPWFPYCKASHLPVYTQMYAWLRASGDREGLGNWNPMLLVYTSRYLVQSTINAMGLLGHTYTQDINIL